MHASGNEQGCGLGSSEDALQRISAGDETALTVLLAQGRKKLASYLRYKLSADLQGLISVEDVIQDAHIAVFRQMRAFEPRGADSFDRWVTAIAIRQLRAAVRRQRAAKRGGNGINLGHGRNVEDSAVAFLDFLSGPSSTPSRTFSKKEAFLAVESAVKLLPEHYQQAVWLVYIEGLPVAEVASQMGRTKRAVNGLCRRGLEMLETHLGSASKFLSRTG